MKLVCVCYICWSFRFLNAWMSNRWFRKLVKFSGNFLCRCFRIKWHIQQIDYCLLSGWLSTTDDCTRLLDQMKQWDCEEEKCSWKTYSRTGHFVCREFVNPAWIWNFVCFFFCSFKLIREGEKLQTVWWPESWKMQIWVEIWRISSVLYSQWNVEVCIEGVNQISQ